MIKLVETIKSLIKPARLKYRMFRDSILDTNFYLKYSGTLNTKGNKKKHASELIFYYHKIEKGLALPQPKVGFGKNTIKYLIDSVNSYQEKYGWDRLCDISFNALSEYKIYNEKFNYSDTYLEKFLSEKAVLQTSNFSEGGTLNLKKEEILSKSNIDFESFAYSRYSIRQFDTKKVDLDIVEKAITIAQKTPSVCNRQSAKVYIINSQEKKSQALNFQNGNTGFGNQADLILLITADIEEFFGIGERHQAYIDGGMFAMSLIYALHSYGIGTCPLNLALEYKESNQLKNALDIKESDALIMMIAIGHLKDEFLVAASPRKKIEEVRYKI